MNYLQGQKTYHRNQLLNSENLSFAFITGSNGCLTKFMYLEGHKIREIVCVHRPSHHLDILTEFITISFVFHHHNEIDNDPINNKKILLMITKNKMRRWTFSSCLRLYQSDVLRLHFEYIIKIRSSIVIKSIAIRYIHLKIHRLNLCCCVVFDDVCFSFFL